MGRFKFCLVGSAQSPVLELPLTEISQLHACLAAARYIEGRMVSIDEYATDCDVLIPATRILMVLKEEG